MNAAITIPSHIYAAVIAQAERQQPSECCGLLGGNQQVARSYYPLRNCAPRPTVEYAAAPADLFDAIRQMRARGEELLAIYHSHPRGAAYPSPTDIELAFYPQAVYLIIAFTPQIELRGFRIIEQRVTEVAIRIST